MTTTPTDDDFSGWVGREASLTAPIAPDPVAALRATLDEHGFAPDGRLPPGAQWLFFNPVARRGELGEDGHPRRDTGDGLLPPVPLPRRMWAGSRIRYLAPVALGATALRRSLVRRIVPKTGRAGRMCFVTVAHTLAVDGRVCIEEEQDIVYREAATPGVAPPPAPSAEPAPVAWERAIVPDTPLLFRYSALTFNGHRIHYDAPYATGVEGYRGLVVHGPLAATLLQAFALACRPGRTLAAFEFKGVAPLIAGEAMRLQAWPVDADDGDTLALRVLSADGALAMTASARLQGEDTGRR